MHELAITREGLERLNAELERLTTEGRREIANRLEHVATSDANRVKSAGYFGVTSPLGQALLGLRRGQIAEVDAPRSRVRFKIQAVEA